MQFFSLTEIGSSDFPQKLLSSPVPPSIHSSISPQPPKDRPRRYVCDTQTKNLSVMIIEMDDETTTEVIKNIMSYIIISLGR